MPALRDRLKANLAALDERIRRACQRAGRSANEVTLVVVTKYAPDKAVSLLPELSRLDLGENRPQQLVRRAGMLPEARWHLIGHLQTNKVKLALPSTVLIHSVDSVKLLERIGAIAGEMNRTAEVLLEVNVSGEESKQGFDADSLRTAWRDCLAAPNVSIRGLMTMAPYTDDPEEARPVFRALRELRDQLEEQAGLPSRTLPHLSMGMSGDFEVAIEEGATLIRVGSAVFDGIDDT